MKTGRDVRQHHYQFAHRALPSMLFGAIDENLGYLLQQPERFVAHVWGFVGKKLAAQGSPIVEGPGPTVQRVALKPGTMWALELPKPEAMAEALYVGIVPLRPEGTPDERLAYFTLEWSFDLDMKESYYILGRWMSDGLHVNLRLKVAPDLASFVASVRNQLIPPQ